MLTVTSTRVSGCVIRPMEEDFMNTLTEPNILVTGKRTDRMDTVLRPGQTMPSMKAHTRTARSTASVLSNGQISQSILESSSTIIFTEKVCIHGLTAGNMRVNGETTKCMEKVPSFGQMAESILESTSMTKNRATVNSFGQMVDVTEVNGAMESKMERAHTSLAQVRKSMVNGSKAKESDGLVVANNKINEIVSLSIIIKISNLICK